MGSMNAGGLSLVWPVLAQVALTIVVLFVLGYFRRQALTARDVRLKDIALSGDTWPAKAKQAANNFTNQFETPVLFYVLAIMAIHVGATGWLMASFAWVFVATRVAHAYVHIGSNDLRIRPLVFLVGCFALIAMLIGVLIAAL
ncbi:MAG: MAPEG family protein [Phreatobacter sp.]|uniref:MAPEG family protein n=1 Tax=Phreatobacter sp. TaxID=1966341 RepID=UPI0027367217|nr:MAPEG family protein [Phreatobacter sp.]MDP2800662.1 MAPEG family protein [Phreatobacter sp.]